MANKKIILGIESSCDETSAAVVIKEKNRIHLVSNKVASSATMQAKWGGVIPEQAAREQLKSIIPVITDALEESHVSPEELDALAVTYGPGLIGSLLIGVETVKILSFVWQKKIIPVNHLLGHFFANWIDRDPNDLPKFPLLGLLVSGGHTDLVLFESITQYKYLGGTRDDAAGECFDKCARMIGFAYPGGPKISLLAEKGDPKAFTLPRPLSDSNDFDFSFSGLKTAFSNLITQLGHANLQLMNSTDINPNIYSSEIFNLSASLQQAIIDTLCKKALRAAREYNIEQIIVAGGVAANNQLVKQLTENFPGKVYAPPISLCTDNAAMIAAAAFFTPSSRNYHKIQADPNLALSSPIV